MEQSNPQDADDGLRLVTCSACGWVHMGVSLGYAFHEVRRFNEWYEQQPADIKSSYRGPVTMKEYLFCDFCGADCTFMRQFEAGDCPDGCTIGPIVAHGDLLYDEAEKHRAIIEAGFENDFLVKMVRRAFLILTQPTSVGLVPHVVARGRWIRDYREYVDAEEEDTLTQGDSEGSPGETEASVHEGDVPEA